MSGGDMAVQVGGDTQQQAVGGNRIQVSSSKKPLFFYVNLAKKYMQHHDDVELSALGRVLGLLRGARMLTRWISTSWLPTTVTWKNLLSSDVTPVMVAFLASPSLMD